MQPLTQSQVDQLLASATRDLAVDSDGKVSCVVGNLALAIREIYAAGEEQGRAKMLKAMAEMIAPSVTDIITEQRSNSARIVSEFVASQPAGNIYSASDNYYSVGMSTRQSSDERWIARVWLPDECRSLSAQRVAKSFFGSTHDEAIAKLATWCEQNMPELTAEQQNIVDTWAGK